MSSLERDKVENVRHLKMELNKIAKDEGELERINSLLEELKQIEGDSFTIDFTLLTGKTMLETAIMRKNTGLVRLLIDSGADVNRENKPIIFACNHLGRFEEKRLGITNMLLDAGANINTRGLLTSAAMNNDIEMIRILISRGADPSIPSVKGLLSVNYTFGSIKKELASSIWSNPQLFPDDIYSFREKIVLLEILLDTLLFSTLPPSTLNPVWNPKSALTPQAYSFLNDPLIGFIINGENDKVLEVISKMPIDELLFPYGKSKKEIERNFNLTPIGIAILNNNMEVFKAIFDKMCREHEEQLSKKQLDKDQFKIIFGYINMFCVKRNRQNMINYLLTYVRSEIETLRKKSSSGKSGGEGSLSKSSSGKSSSGKSSSGKGGGTALGGGKAIREKTKKIKKTNKRNVKTVSARDVNLIYRNIQLFKPLKSSPV